MKRWEYAVVTGNQSPDKTTKIRFTTISQWEYKSYIEFLNDVGNQGWELVSHEHVSIKAGWICTFKRELE